MMHSTQGLYDMLNRQLIEIDKQIEAIKKEAWRSTPVHIKPEDAAIYQAVDRNGKPLLSDMLVAKATVLSAMANLKLEATLSRTGPPRGRPMKGH